MKNLQNLLDYGYKNGTELDSEGTMEIMKNWFKKAERLEPMRNIFSFPEENQYGMTLGMDGYTHMNELTEKGWRILSPIGNRPYDRYALSEDRTKLLNYTEGDITIRKTH